jgi:hypothetical protein
LGYVDPSAAVVQSTDMLSGQTAVWIQNNNIRVGSADGKIVRVLGSKTPKGIFLANVGG